jgi:hypothetical protein
MLMSTLAVLAPLLALLAHGILVKFQLLFSKPNRRSVCVVHGLAGSWRPLCGGIWTMAARWQP